MKIGIIGAMEEETRHLKDMLTDVESWTRAEIFFYKGNYGRHEVILVRSGIGKVQAAMTTALLIHEFKVDAVLNTGSAGGISSDLSVGDVVVANQSACFAVDVTGFGYAM
jgi:adenosylhomocysteine nucleosidase